MKSFKSFSIFTNSTYVNIQSNLYQEVTFGMKKMWPYKTGDLLNEVQYI
jgi:hypothetical protein